MQRWELKRLWVPLKIKADVAETSRTTSRTMVWSVSDESTEKAQEEAAQLAAEGWELVSVVPKIAGRVYSISGRNEYSSAGCDVTSGYYMFFKRALFSQG